MRVTRGWSIGAAVLASVVGMGLATPARGQRPSPSEVFGIGPAGTIGRGTDDMPNGPSDWGGGSRGSPPANGYRYRDFPGREQYGLPPVQGWTYPTYYYTPQPVAPAWSYTSSYFAPQSTAPSATTYTSNYLAPQSTSPSATTYTSNYYAPQSAAPPAPTAPYLTRFSYEPGDGYRYPLYYNPATRGYYYYPVPSRSLATR